MNIKIDKFTSASGAAETVELGFKPDYVKVLKQNALDTEIIGIEWFGEDMGDDKAFQTSVAQNDGGGDVFSTRYVATGGNIISTTGSTPSVSGETLSFSGGEGFIVDASFLDTGDVVWFVAMKSD